MMAMDSQMRQQVREVRLHIEINILSVTEFEKQSIREKNQCSLNSCQNEVDYPTNNPLMVIIN